MARPGKYRIPKEFKDEDIWFKWFTKKQLFYFTIAALLACGSIILFTKIHLTLIGTTLAILFLIIGFAVPRFDMPADKYLLGGGIPLEVIITRILVKFFLEKKKLYITDFNIEEERK